MKRALPLAALALSATGLLSAAPFQRETTGGKKVAGSIQRTPGCGLGEALGRLGSTPLEGSGSGVRRIHPAAQREGAPRHETPARRIPTAKPRGTMMAGVTSYSGIQMITDGYLGRLDGATGKVTKLFSGAAYGAGQDYDLQSGAERDGILYIPKVEEGFFGTEIVWARIDLATGQELEPISFGNEWAAYGYSVTYDPALDLFHMLSLDIASGAYGNYATVDPNDWTLTRHGMLSGRGFLGAMAYNPADGQLWVFDSSNACYTLVPKTTTMVDMGEIADDYDIIADKRTTAAVYSPLDESFAFFWLDSDHQCTRLLYLDTDDLEITEGPALSPSNPYVGYMWCEDPYAPSNAPAHPVVDVLDFPEASLKGKLSFTVPTETYGAKSITGMVDTKVTIDGNVLLESALKPGETRNLELSVAEGLHQLEVSCSLSGVAGPSAKRSFYAGNDQPTTPTGLKVVNGLLTWNPSSPTTGAHGGYVCGAELGYEVALDGEVLTPTPISGTSFQLPSDGELAVAEIEVTATARGKRSEPAVIREALGEGLQLPWSMVPSTDEAELFKTWSASGTEFEFGKDFDRGHNIFELWLDYGEGADDWVFLPPTAISDISRLYEVAFNYRSAAYYEGGEDLDVCIGRYADPEAMTTVLYSHRDLYQIDDTELRVPFAVGEPGNYVVGIHCLTKPDKGYGVHLYGFSMRQTEALSAVPGDATDVVIKGQPKGILKADVSLTLPSLDMTGAPLGAGSEVTVTVSAPGTDPVSLKGRPGERVSGVVEVAKSGMTEFSLLPSNANGKGVARTAKAYVGLDRPRAPQNIACSASEDNRSMTVTWEPPTETGENGGYVNLENLEYVIYTVQSVTFNEIATLPATARSYTYTPAESAQFNLVMGPAARNEVGESRYSGFVDDNIGIPYPTPITEKFSSYGFGISPVFYNMAPAYENSAWESTSSIAALGTGAQTDVDRGALVVYNTGLRPTRGQLVLPKFSTKGLRNAYFSLRWLDWAHAPVFSLHGRVHGETGYRELGRFEPSRPKAGEWVESRVSLPKEFNDREWVDFRIEAELSSDASEYGFLDAIAIGQNVETDLKLASITGPEVMTLGDEADLLVTVVNAGLETVSGKLTVTIADAKGGNQDSQSTRVSRLQEGQTYLAYVHVEALRELFDGGGIVVSATIDCDGDELETNNTLSHSISLLASQAPCVGDLQAEWADDEKSAARLSWSEPDLGYGDRDNFELLPPFAVSEELGIWKNLDLDGKEPFVVSGLEWENNRVPIAWQPFDAVALGVGNDTRLCPHSGRMYLMARSISYDEEAEEEPVQSSDWLISPEVVGGTQIEFWYGTIDPDLKEYVELWVSATDQDPASFRKVRTFSKDGQEAWENVRYTLPADARYFALVYASFDSFAAMLDDVSFTPVQLQSWEVDHYSVLRAFPSAEEKEVGQTNATSYVDDTNSGFQSTYRVLTAVRTSDGFRTGPASNRATLEGSGIDDLRALEGISAGKGFILVSGHEGETLSLYDASGRHLRQLAVTAPSQRFQTEAGVFIVKSGNALAKVMVK